ncbi:matrixin family metalloprotease, partial [Pseudomonas gingeri]
SGSGATVNIENSGDTVSASGDTINLAGTGLTVNAAGNNDTFSSASSSHGDTIDMTGTGTTLDISGATITIAAGSQVIIDGSNDIINAAGNDNISFIGSDDSLTGGIGDVVTTQGAGENVTLGTGSSLDVESGSATANLSSDTLTVGAGSQATLDGSGDTVNLAANSNSLLNVDGGGSDTIKATGDVIDMIARNSGDSIVGSGDSVNVNGSSSFSGTNDSIVVDSGSDLKLSGGNDSVTLGGAGDFLGLLGGTYSVSGTGDTISTLGSTSVNLSGGNDSVALGGTGDFLDLLGGTYTVSGSDDTIDTSANTQVDASGSNDAFNLGVDSGVTADGSGDTLNGEGITNGDAYDVNGGGGISGGGDSGGGDGGDGGGGGDGGDPPDLPPTENDDDNTGYGFAGSKAATLSTAGNNIGFIAQYDLSQGNQAAALAAEKALQQAVDMATATPTAGTGSAVLDGAKFDQQVITWSLADSQGTQAAPFSGYMDSTDESVVQGAFNTWAASMPGVTFEEVSDSAQSDIRVGFGDFNTATTGIIGYTSYQANNGQIAPDAIVRVEDPTQNALTTGADGQQTYAGTEATLSQTLLHEIGHALGLGDNADQNSVMNYQLTASNRTLDSTDLVGIGSLYGSGSSTASVGSSGVSQLIQAMSTFNADTGVADTTLLPPALLNNNVTLSASAHAA